MDQAVQGRDVLGEQGVSIVRYVDPGVFGWGGVVGGLDVDGLEDGVFCCVC